MEEGADSPTIRLSALPYSAGNLVVAMCTADSAVHPSVAKAVKSRPSTAHFHEYISAMMPQDKPGTIIVERPYSDREVFLDYWAFVSDGVSDRAFSCIRLHFFNKSIGDTGSSSSPEEISWEDLSGFIETKPGYLGFIVVLSSGPRPIAFTCLKRHTKDGEAILVFRKYAVNLAGHDLSVESLGFRSQDGVTSACATCAMWVAFQKTSEAYKHEMLSPGEITARALNLRQRDTHLPAEQGLHISDMERAIFSVPEIRAFTHYPKKNMEPWKKAEYILNFMIPFLDLGIPVILILELGHGQEVHAVAVTGYVVQPAEPNKAQEQDLRRLLRHRSITGLIVHDDNIGPFVRFDIAQDGTMVWKRDGHGKIEWHMKGAICLAHHSIKIYPVGENYDMIYHYNAELRKCCFAADSDFLDRINEAGSWSVRVWRSNDYKTALKEFLLSGGKKSEALRLPHSAARSRCKAYMQKVLVKNLPDYILVLSKRGRQDDHDIVLKLSGPWKNEMLVQVVPLVDSCLELFQIVCSHLTPAQEAEESVGPVLSYIKEQFGQVG